MDPQITTLVLLVAIIVVLLVIVFMSGCVIYIPNNRIGVLEKLWSLRGSIRDGFIACSGEAGFQPDVVRGGYHFFVPFQYRVHRAPLVTIPQGEIGYVFARDGVALAPTQTLASNVAADDFEDVRAFLGNGGQKGPQRKILREGTYAINLAQFIVLTSERTYAISLSGNEAELFSQMSDVIEERGGFHPVVIKDAEDLIG